MDCNKKNFTKFKVWKLIQRIEKNAVKLLKRQNNLISLNQITPNRLEATKRRSQSLSHLNVNGMQFVSLYKLKVTNS